MTDLFAPAGKTFLVTGGASGLGARYVEIFAEEGAKGVAILDIQEENGKKLAEHLSSSLSSKVIFVKCDVSNEEEINDALDIVLKEFKQLDVIINNAGIMVDNPATWRKACDVNWQGLVDFTMKGIKHMRTDKGGVGGTIINISSTAALCRLNFLPIYSGSKMAVLHFSQSISRCAFHEQTGVRILTVCFGPTATPLLDGLESRLWDESAVEVLKHVSVDAQSAESAVECVRKMFKEAPNGSIWLSINDKPAQDITPLVSGTFTEFEKTCLLVDII